MLDKQTAYTKWLGIKVHDQPPTLYRLLGMDAFESDADAISYAADSRMALLRQFQTGDNAPLAEEILNELSKARVTLLNAEKKVAYDARLRQRMAPQATAAVSSGPPPRAEPIAAPVRPAQASAAPPALDLDALTSEARSTKPTPLGRHKKKSNPLVWVAAAASVALVIVAIVVVNSLSGGEDSSAKDASKTVAVRSETPKPPAHPVAPEPSVMPRPVDKSPKVVPDPVVVAPVEPPTPTPTPPPVAVALAEPPPPDSEKPIPAPTAEPPKAPATAAPAPTEPALIPIPDAQAQAKATKLVKEVYGNEWIAAKTADEKQALAKKLLEKAMESEKDRVAQFVLFRRSKEVAEQASDCQTAFEAIERTASVFQVDAMEMDVEAVKKCASAAATIDQQTLVAKRAAEMSEQAVARDDFTIATPMIDLAISAAKKARDETLVRRSTDRKAEVEKVAQEYATAKPAIAILEKTPLDAEANLVVGKYQSLFKGDWERGLPKLARGSDRALMALSETDLTGAASSDEQAKIGDSWWNLAEDMKGVEKKQAEKRGGHWYKQALPGLSGVVMDRVQSRLRLLQEDMFLADLPAEGVRVFGEDQQQMSFKGKRLLHGLWAHPPADNSSSHRAYQLDKGFRTLRGDAGVKTGGAPASPLTFRIVGDGKLLWQSKQLQQADVAIPFRVNVAKVTKLELYVDCPGRNGIAWAIWVDPVVER